MGVKMKVPAVIYNLGQRNTALQSNIEALQSLKTDLELYVADDELQAEAYDSHKEYVQIMQIPVVNGLIMLCQTLMASNEKYRSIISSGAPAPFIDQDDWEETLSELNGQYYSLRNQAASLESENNYSACTETGQEYDNQYIINNIHAEINLLYMLINDYKTKLQKLDEMISQLNGIYGQAEILAEAVNNAINQMNNVHVNADGSYVTCVMNMEPFKDLEDAMASNELTDMLREEIGEDTYQALINGELSDEEMQEVLNVASGLGYQYVTDNIGVPGRYEFYIYPNITVYTETTCSMELGADLPTSVEVSLEEDADCLLDLISTNVTSGNFGVEVGVDGLAANYTVEIDENSEYYYEVSSNLVQTSVECGVNSSIPDANGSAEIQTTVAVGATYTSGSSNNGWETVTVTELAYEDVPQPEVIVELQEVPTEVETVDVGVYPSNVDIMQYDSGISDEEAALGTAAIVVIILIELSPLGRLCPAFPL